MPRLILTETAVEGLKRRHPPAARAQPADGGASGGGDQRHLAALETEPQMNPLFDGIPRTREMFINLVEAGYVTLYRHEAAEDVVYVLAFRPREESGH